MSEGGMNMAISMKHATTTQIAETLRDNICHGNCICSDADWCIQKEAAKELIRLRNILGKILNSMPFDVIPAQEISKRL